MGAVNLDDAEVIGADGLGGGGGGVEATGLGEGVEGAGTSKGPSSTKSLNAATSDSFSTIIHTS